ncbi:MAG: cysteine hydrolase family protein, partial [Nitrososphaerales archaeon]
TMMKLIEVNGFKVNPALLIIDMQNGFCSKGGSYDKLGIDLSHYQKVIPNIKTAISHCRKIGIPLFYTQAVREASGIDLFTRRHKMFPKKREERIKKIPICVRGTWDSEVIAELKPGKEDHVVIKRRDSAFQDTELDLWLSSSYVDTILFCGADTSVCVDSSVRDAFNRGFDIVVVSDGVASMRPEFHKATLETIKEWYGSVMSTQELIENLHAG